MSSNDAYFTHEQQCEILHLEKEVEYIYNLSTSHLREPELEQLWITTYQLISLFDRVRYHHTKHTLDVKNKEMTRALFLQSVRSFIDEVRRLDINAPIFTDEVENEVGDDYMPNLSAFYQLVYRLEHLLTVIDPKTQNSLLGILEGKS